MMNSAQSLRNFVSFFSLVFCINTCKTSTSLRTHRRFSPLKCLLLFIGTSQGNLRFVCSFFCLFYMKKTSAFQHVPLLKESLESGCGPQLQKEQQPIGTSFLMCLSLEHNLLFTVFVYHFCIVSSISSSS